MSDYTWVNIGLAVKSMSQEQLDMYQEETVWQAAVTLSEQVGFSQQSDEFVVMYRNLQQEYSFLKEHHCYLQYMAMKTLNNLIATNRLAMYIPQDGDVGDIADGIQHLSSIILSTFMWLHASMFLTWMDNDQWKELPDEAQIVMFPVQVHNDMFEKKEPTND